MSHVCLQVLPVHIRACSANVLFTPIGRTPRTRYRLWRCLDKHDSTSYPASLQLAVSAAYFFMFLGPTFGAHVLHGCKQAQATLLTAARLWDDYGRCFTLAFKPCIREFEVNAGCWSPPIIGISTAECCWLRCLLDHLLRLSKLSRRELHTRLTPEQDCPTGLPERASAFVCSLQPVISILCFLMAHFETQQAKADSCQSTSVGCSGNVR